MWGRSPKQTADAALSLPQLLGRDWGTRGEGPGHYRGLSPTGAIGVSP